MATLAKIITGDVQIEAHSLLQAFAEANASLRQANTIIGDYQMVDEGLDEEAAVVAGGNGWMHNESQQPLPVPEHLAVRERPSSNSRLPCQPSLLSHGETKDNHYSSSPELVPEQSAETHAREGKPKPSHPRLFALPSSA